MNTYNELVEKLNTNIPEGNVKVILTEKELISIAENLLPLKKHKLTNILYESGRFTLKLKYKDDTNC